MPRQLEQAGGEDASDFSEAVVGGRAQRHRQVAVA
jgi:hypothetical protein